MLNILFSIAGAGQRFKDAGYTTPKPLIDVCGQPMLKLAVDNITKGLFRIKRQLIFICQEELVKNYPRELVDATRPPTPFRGRIFRKSINGITEGAACTCLLASDLINNENELIITDCDHIVEQEDHIKQGILYFRKHNIDGGSWCFIGNNPKWSFIKVENGLATQVAEKNPISEVANTGTYYFRHGSDFVTCANMMVSNNDRVNNEFYVAPVLNYLIKNNKRVAPFIVNDMVGLGTPDDLKKYIERYENH